MIIGSYFFYWLIYCILYFFILIFSKLHAHFQSMEVRNSSFAAFIDIFTANTYVMVIMSDSSICKYMCSLHVPRLLINFKIRKIMTYSTYFCIFLCIIYALFWYCFFHLIGLFYVTWLFIFYKFTLFWFILFLSDERAAYTWNVRLYYPYRQYTNFFLFLFVCVL